ncbi:hypothetical protein ACFO3I_02405 [Rheinheimera marina]|uniref:DUF2306 domain-containing protein n=1 Tax=Rheinheimera marina TaxID=1774958 RepID=A0ABV9JJG4_9GAMM
MLLTLHVLISLLALLAGACFSLALLKHKPGALLHSLFWWLTLLTSLSGVILPAEQFLPSHLFVILSLLVLAVSGYAWWKTALSGGWRIGFIVCSLFAFYLNAFVAVVQAFMKLPPLQQLAPTQSEPPFAVAQGVLFVIFLLLGYLSCSQRNGWGSQ